SGFATSPDIRARKTSNMSPSKVDHDRVRNFMRDLAAAQDIRLFLEEFVTHAVPLSSGSHTTWDDPLGDLALAELLADCLTHPRPEEVVIYAWAPGNEDSPW